MARMQYVRPFDDALAVDTGFPGYRAQFLSHLESAVLIASHIEAGGCGPGLHYHHSDQLYFLMHGTMNVQLGHDVHRVEAGSLVFIPAGLAHRNWNDGPQPETHFEIIAPATLPGNAIALFVDTPDDVPTEHRAMTRGFVQPVDIAHQTEPIPGFRLTPLVDPDRGSRHVTVNYAEVSPGGAGPGTHIHEFDQYYLVLDGELTIEVALQRHIVTANTLVVLPAGVPHRQYNDGSDVEKHLAILAPTPEPGRPWDQGVIFGANGEVHAGVTTGQMTGVQS